MIEVGYKPSFIKQFKHLSWQLQQEVLKKIDLFKLEKNHKQLKVHKLHGWLADKYGFYVNYKYRIVFKYESSKKEVALLYIDDHDAYKSKN